MEEKIGMAKLWALFLVVLALAGSAQAAVDGNMSRGGMRRLAGASGVPVPITLLTSAVGMGAVCMDGTPPAYHMDPGSGAGKNRWIVHLEGGSWCESVASCLYRKASRLGSSNLMNKQMYFGGILSSSPAENPDFFSWNRVMIRYCDGASFAGEGYDAGSKLYFRGQRIWDAVIQHLLSIGMSSADQVLLTGSSAGALAVVLHCDQFGAFFAGRRTTVKCLADAGFFLDAVNVAGGRTLRSYFGGVVATGGPLRWARDGPIANTAVRASTRRRERRTRPDQSTHPPQSPHEPYPKQLSAAAVAGQVAGPGGAADDWAASGGEADRGAASGGGGWSGRRTPGPGGTGGQPRQGRAGDGKRLLQPRPRHS